MTFGQQNSPGGVPIDAPDLRPSSNANAWASPSNVDAHGLSVGLVSLGCAKNLVDSEIMLGLLREAGYRITNEKEEADVLVVNTCGFIGPAKEESVDTIIELGELKEKGRCRALIVAGCLAQRYREELMREMPEIDAVIGTGDFTRIVETISQALAGERQVCVGRPVYQYSRDLPRVQATPGHTAYLKIAEGCDNACSYCVIPALRGPLRSRPLNDLVDEAASLAARGVKEIILIAQDTTAYGLDLYGEYRLAGLLRALSRIDVLRWVRVLYSYPSRFTDDLIEVVAREEKICKYLDIPLQHGSDEILKQMNREGDREQALALIRRLKDAIPDLVLRTSLIVGFPGETEAHFEELLDFIREIRFDHVGVFTYSQEEDTPAGARPDQVPEEVKQERFRRAMEVQQGIAFERRRRWVGRELEVLVEGADPDRAASVVVSGCPYWGRTRGQAPGIDGATYLKGKDLKVGEIYRARVVGTEGYDLLGQDVQS